MGRRAVVIVPEILRSPRTHICAQSQLDPAGRAAADGNIEVHDGIRRHVLSK